MKKMTFTLTVALLTAIPFFAQTVTTFTEGTPDDAIAIDSNGNIYCSNYVGDKVFKFTTSGDVTPFIIGLNTPNGLAFNSNDELYVCDGQGNTIYKYGINGSLLNTYPVTGHPSGIVKSFTDETMIFTEYSGSKINRLELDGTVTEISSATGLNGPVGIVYDENGVLFIGNYNDREIYKVFENGDVEFIAEVPTDGGSMPNLGFISYGLGYIWGTTMGSDKIYKINPNGINEIELFAGNVQGSQDGDINEATFHTPNGIAFNDTEDKMYISDFSTKNLRIISDVVLATNNQVLKKSEVIVYPNPVNNNATIIAELYNDNNYKIVIHDLLGKTIYASDGASENLKIAATINVENWNKGIYFIKLKIGEEIITKKMIK